MIISGFRNKFKTNNQTLCVFFIIKEDKCSSLAPIEVKILLYWGSVQEMATESGTVLPENA